MSEQQNEKDDAEIARIMAMSDEEILAGVTPETIAALRAERDEAVRVFKQSRASGMEDAIRIALSDCSTVDFYGISDEGVANLAMLAARAAARFQDPSPAQASGSRKTETPCE